MRDRVVTTFRGLVGIGPDVVVRAPGRVNLMGDHTDYNEGFVLPAAIEQATWIAASARRDRTVRLLSLEEGGGEFELDTLRPESVWTDYVAGTIWALGDPPEFGFDAVIGTTIPVGAGLSSSAAIELGTARIVAELTGRVWEPVAAALAGQRAENEFVGMPCGIMDQLIVATAREGAASLIDCRTLDQTHAVLPDEAAVVILDTSTRRRLVDSAYEDRRGACERVSAALGVAALRDATAEMVEAATIDETDRRRARHVVAENTRTQQMAAAFVAGDVAAAGRVMNESHVSLRDDYDVSGEGLDAMVSIASAQPGCWGARMTGAGFAGCAVALVHRDALDGFSARVEEQYTAATGRTPVLYPTVPAAGVSVA